jgi:RimJ/RimL family protein N-acetyltransferase
MILRRATEADAQRLFDWRNDPATRGNSRSMAPVSWADHVRWLTASLTNSARELLVAERQGEAVGTVRLDYSDTDCEISWTVAPERRGHGIGKEMIGLAIGNARVAKLRAEIKLDNEPSQRIVRSLGFVESERRSDLAVWRYVRELE